MDETEIKVFLGTDPNVPNKYIDILNSLTYSNPFNIYPNGKLLIRDNYYNTLFNDAIRLRKIKSLGEQNYEFELTRKFDSHVDKDGIKTRTEINVRMKDPTIEEFVDGLWGHSLRYDKYRIQWRFDNAIICFDKLPIMGWFVEIESKDKDKIMEIFTVFGLDSKRMETKSYFELIAQCCSEKKLDILNFYFNPEELLIM
jgi:predicted adenylyl cyclase CyaB